MRFAVADYPTYVFDCDGVILDSNSLKSEAFRALASPFGAAAADALLEYHHRHGGVSRQQKLAWFLDSVLGLRGTERELLEARMLGDFGRICSERLADCPTVPGVEAFLRSLPRAARAFVVSGGAQSEVEAALQARDLSRHFVSILGNPASKRQNMQQLRAAGLFARGGLYFGDAELDMELAGEFALDFVFVYGVSEWRDGCERCPHRQVADFTELQAA